MPSVSTELGTAPLTLVLVTCNSGRWLGPFFESWKSAVATCTELARTPMVVADAGSTDETVRVIAKMCPDARVLTVGNIGYGAAGNVAVEMVNTPWFLLCNPDLTFPGEFVDEFLRPLVVNNQRKAKPGAEAGGMPALRNAGVPTALVAPLILNPDGSVQPSVGRFPTIGGMLRDQFRDRGRRKYCFPQPVEAAAIDWATGACLLINRDAFVQVGGFDSKFFLYMEEVDLQRRLVAAGYQNWFCPGTDAVRGGVIHHAPNANRTPRPQVQRWAARGVLRYFAKHGNALQMLACRGLIMLARRLPVGEVCASRQTILARLTGPE